MCCILCCLMGYLSGLIAACGLVPFWGYGIVMLRLILNNILYGPCGKKEMLGFLEVLRYLRMISCWIVSGHL